MWMVARLCVSHESAVLCMDMVQDCISGGTRSCSCINHWQDGGILLHWSSSGYLSQTLFLGDSILCSLLLLRQEDLEAAEPGQEKVPHVPVCGGRRTSPACRVQAGPSSSFPLLLTIILPLLFVPLEYVRSSQSRTQRGREGFPAQQTGWEIMIPFL